MVCYDGYILSHTFMPFDLPDQKTVDAFLPLFKPDYALRPEEPANLNTVTLPDVRLDVRGELAHKLHGNPVSAAGRTAHNARRGGRCRKKVCRNIWVGQSDPFIESYRCDDADCVALGLGSLTYQLRVSVDALRKEGIRLASWACASTGLSRTKPSPGH